MSAPAPAPTASPRLLSLDALRGFDMFWILGADVLVQALRGLSDAAPVRLLAEQLEHKAWHGFAFYDLIFPLFVFIVGVSLVFSLARARETTSRGALVGKILRRAAILFLFGILYNGGLAQPWPEVRLVGVLQRIAIVYAVCGILFCWLKPRALAATGVAILLGYWALMAWTPIRDLTLQAEPLAAQLGVENPTREQAEPLFAATTERTHGHYEPGLNVANHVDFAWLPGRMYNRYFDPEGIVSTLPAVVTGLLGVLAGLWLRRRDISDTRKTRGLLFGGVAAVALGWLWHLGGFPVNKQLWTSSFVLVAGGWSLVLLAVFYWVVDVRQQQGWCRPFVWIGMNPITLYLATSLVSFGGIARRIAGGSIEQTLDRVTPGFGEFVLALLTLSLLIGLAAFLYRRKIFLKV